jgi:hypothetical protein
MKNIDVDRQRFIGSIGQLLQPGTTAAADDRRPGLAARSRIAELSDALAQVRSLYCENAAKPRLIVALDNLIGCACIHFAEETRLATGREQKRLLAQSEKPDNILNYMLLLREYVDRFDQVGLLSDLHFLDCWLQDLIVGEDAAVPYKSRQRRLAPLTPA